MALGHDSLEHVLVVLSLSASLLVVEIIHADVLVNLIDRAQMRVTVNPRLFKYVEVINHVEGRVVCKKVSRHFDRTLLLLFVLVLVLVQVLNLLRIQRVRVFVDLLVVLNLRVDGGYFGLRPVNDLVSMIVKTLDFISVLIYLVF